MIRAANGDPEKAVEIERRLKGMRDTLEEAFAYASSSDAPIVGVIVATALGNGRFIISVSHGTPVERLQALHGGLDDFLDQVEQMRVKSLMTPEAS